MKPQALLNAVNDALANLAPGYRALLTVKVVRHGGSFDVSGYPTLLCDPRLTPDHADPDLVLRLDAVASVPGFIRSHYVCPSDVLWFSVSPVEEKTA